MKQEGYGGADDVRLRTSLVVPKSAVGRLIGKAGKNVKDIQHTTGAIIKLLSKVDVVIPFQGDQSSGPLCSMPLEESSTAGTSTASSDSTDNNVTVDVYGNFVATQVCAVYSCSNS